MIWQDLVLITVLFLNGNVDQLGSSSLDLPIVNSVIPLKNVLFA